jgi:hypothetical protein
LSRINCPGINCHVINLFLSSSWNFHATLHNINFAMSTSTFHTVTCDNFITLNPEILTLQRQKKKRSCAPSRRFCIVHMWRCKEKSLHYKTFFSVHSVHIHTHISIAKVTSHVIMSEKYHKFFQWIAKRGEKREKLWKKGKITHISTFMILLYNIAL